MFDAISGAVYTKEDIESIRVGNIIWERLEANSDIDLLHQRSLLIDRWISTARMMLCYTPGLRLTWPKILEDATGVELKSEIVNET